MKDYQPNSLDGRYIRFGVREHGMGAIMNGISISGLTRAFGGTFLVFSDYMRGAVRVAAISHYPTIFVWTHDSIGVGEDGPTHQPVEHFAALRAMPNLLTIRPADAYETAAASARTIPFWFATGVEIHFAIPQRAGGVIAYSPESARYRPDQICDGG